MKRRQPSLVFSSAILGLCGQVCLIAAPIPDSICRDLVSENFEEREAAQQALLAWAGKSGKDARRALYKAAIDFEEPEIALRARLVLLILIERDYLSTGDGYLGVSLSDFRLGENAVGVLVGMTIEGGAAHTAGIRSGDTILAVDGLGWSEEGATLDLIDTIKEKKPMDRLSFKVKRFNQKVEEIEVILGRRPVADLTDIPPEALQGLEKKNREEHLRAWFAKHDLEYDPMFLER